MREVPKTAEPALLANNKFQWLVAYKANPTSYRRYRYRAAPIKQALVAETDNKCVYCESRIGHNTPGDAEHKVPSSVDIDLHFEWNNLTVACTECNRRKNDYYDAIKPFLDPNFDSVETRVLHYGPVVGWAHGDAAAEITVKTLQLHSEHRNILLKRKIEKISEVSDKVARLVSEAGEPLEPVLRAELRAMTEKSAEYSAMVSEMLRTAGVQL
jgi:hypothetical protein